MDLASILLDAGARISLSEDAMWQRPQVQESLVIACRARLLPLLAPMVESALLLPPGQGGLPVPPLFGLICEYALPVGWDQIQEEIGVCGESNP